MTDYELVLPDGQRAESPDLDGLALAARLLVAEGERAGASSARLRRDLLVTRAGLYDGPVTAWLRGTRERPSRAGL